MYALLLSAANYLLGWVWRSVIVKFIFYFALFFVCTEFIALLAPMLPGATAISSAFGDLPSGVWWFIDLVRLDIGMPMVLGALVTRFMIKRIPVIG
jgi:hypothetical protein